MHLWQDGLLALLAAIGLASLLWGAVRGLFFSRPRLRKTTAMGTMGHPARAAVRNAPPWKGRSPL